MSVSNTTNFTDNFIRSQRIFLPWSRVTSGHDTRIWMYTGTKYHRLEISPFYLTPHYGIYFLYDGGKNNFRAYIYWQERVLYRFRLNYIMLSDMWQSMGQKVLSIPFCKEILECIRLDISSNLICIPSIQNFKVWCNIINSFY